MVKELTGFSSLLLSVIYLLVRGYKSLYFEFEIAIEKAVVTASWNDNLLIEWLADTVK